MVLELTGIDEARGKCAIEMISKRQAELFVRKPQAWQFISQTLDKLLIFLWFEAARGVNENAARF